MIPRNTTPIGDVLRHDYAAFLADHPEAFDCIIYPAKSADYDEQVADNRTVGTLLDSDERTQSYDPPIAGRALIVPSPDLDFDATESGAFEAFHSATDGIRILLSASVRRYSLVQWLEFQDLDSDVTVERTVYVQDVSPMGRTLMSGNVYTCYPLPAMGIVPDAKPDEMDEGDNEGVAGTGESPVDNGEDPGTTGFNVQDL